MLWNLPLVKTSFYKYFEYFTYIFCYCLILGILFQTYRFQSDVRRLFIHVEPPNKESQEEPSLWGGEGKPAQRLHGTHFLRTVSMYLFLALITIKWRVNVK